MAGSLKKSFTPRNTGETFQKTRKGESSSVRNGDGGTAGAGGFQRITFVFDASGSMFNALSNRRQTRLEAVGEAAKKIIQKMNPQDRLSVILFDTDVRKLYPGDIPKDSYDAGAVKKAAQGMGAGTSLWAALRTAIEDRNASSAMCQVVIFTDGEATDGSSPNRARVMSFLEGAPGIFKLHFITSEIARRDKQALSALPKAVVVLREISNNFSWDEVQGAFGAVSDEVRQAYASSVASKGGKESQSFSVQAGSLNALLEIAKSGNSKVALEATRGIVQLTAGAMAAGLQIKPGVSGPAILREHRALPSPRQSLALPPTPPSRSRPGSRGPSPGSHGPVPPANILPGQRSASNSPRNHGPGERERAWMVPNRFASYMYSEIKGRKLEEENGVRIDIPADAGVDGNQRFTIIGARSNRVGIDKAYEDLDQILKDVRTVHKEAGRKE